MTFIIIIISFILGILFGSYIADFKWIANTKEPSRILCKHKFYKVVDIEDADSWKYLKIHEDK